jgi:hypothetical protein
MLLLEVVAAFVVVVVAATEMMEEAVSVVTLEGAARLDHHLEPNWCASCVRKLVTWFSAVEAL